MGGSLKGLTTSLTIRIKSPNRKQKWRVDITDIIAQGFKKFLKEF